MELDPEILNHRAGESPNSSQYVPNHPGLFREFNFPDSRCVASRAAHLGRQHGVI
jgi:hypothetical protein